MKKLFLFSLILGLFTIPSLAGKISITTEKAVGENITIDVNSSEPKVVWEDGSSEKLQFGLNTLSLKSQTFFIEGDFTRLKCLNNNLTKLEFIEDPGLITLMCFNNNLTSLDVSKCAMLSVLYCYNNQLTELNTSENTGLTYVQCNNNKLTSLDISKSKLIKELNCSDNMLSNLDIVDCNQISSLKFGNNNLTSLDLSGCNNLKVFSCFNNNINLVEMTKIVETIPTISGYRKGLIELMSNDAVKHSNVISKDLYKKLQGKNWEIMCKEPNKYSSCELAFFPVTLNPSDKIVVAEVEEGLDLNEVAMGTILHITPSDDVTFTALTANDKDILTDGKYLVLGNTTINATTQNKVKTYAVTIGDDIENGTITLSGYNDMSKVPEGTEITVTATPDDGYELIQLWANDTDIKDEMKFTVSEDIIVDDTNTIVIDATFDEAPGMVSMTTNKGEKDQISIQVDQYATLHWEDGSTQALNPSVFNTFYPRTKSFTVEGNITKLDVSNIGLTKLDVTKCPKLVKLECKYNWLNELDLSKSHSMKYLFCTRNQITSLDLSNCPNLSYIYCNKNNLETLDISKCEQLEELLCSENNISSIIVGTQPLLAKFYCATNNLTEVDVTKCKKLSQFDCSNNKFTALDLSQNTKLWKIECFGNQIKLPEMQKFIEGLPQCDNSKGGLLRVMTTEADETSNQISMALSDMASSKNYRASYYAPDNDAYPALTFYNVTCTPEDKMLVPEMEDGLELNNIAIGTVLHFNAPEKYVFRTLTANNIDIKEKGRCTIVEATNVDAAVELGAKVAVDTSKIGIYPNPVINIVEVQVPAELIGKKARLYTENGQCVREILLNATTVQANISDLNAGVYFLCIEGATLKVIKL